MIPKLVIRLYLLILVVVFILLNCITPMVESLLMDEALVADRELSRGVFFLLSEKIKGPDEQSIRDNLAALQPEFGFPLHLFRMDEIDPGMKSYADLKAGLIVRDWKADRTYMRLKDSNLVLVTGPHTLMAVIDKSRAVFQYLFFILLILPAGLWAFSLHKSLKKIENVAHRFVAGDLTARLRLPGVLAMENIASAFNYMAEKTQGLINSQKDLLNSVAHEIRTPLSRIRFSLAMLREKTKSFEDGLHHIDDIETDITEVSDLVDEILTYQRFERDRLSNEPLSRIDLVALLKETASREGTPGLTLTMRSPETCRMFSCEPRYLGRALRNLVRNALRYGKSHVDVILEAHDSGVRIHVDDDGPGIPPSEAERIFDPFYRLDQSRGRDTGGFGLGLSIAWRIARWHGGSVSLSNSPLGGARFSLDLPDPDKQIAL